MVEKVIDCFNITKIPKNETAVDEKTLCRKRIFFIIEGKYKITGPHQEEQKLHGALSLLADKENEKYGYSIKFTTDGKIAEFSYERFKKKMGLSYEEIIEKG